MNRSSAGKYNSWEDLNSPSVTVAVTMGTVQEKRARALFNKAKIITVSAPARDYQEVLAGRADASMTSNLEAANLVKKIQAASTGSGSGRTQSHSVGDAASPE